MEERAENHPPNPESADSPLIISSKPHLPPRRQERQEKQIIRFKDTTKPKTNSCLRNVFLQTMNSCLSWRSWRLGGENYVFYVFLPFLKTGSPAD
jgi:hypothetical protein